jgi:predicted transcriptional regulator
MTLQEATTMEQLLGTVGEAMRRDVVLLAVDMTAERAVHQLEHKAVSGAPVVDRGRVVGVITLRDLLVPTLLDRPGSSSNGCSRYGHRLAGLRVHDLMSDDPVTAQPGWSLLRATQAMVDSGVNRLPVVDQKGRPLGLLTRDDVLRTLVVRDRVAAIAPGGARGLTGGTAGPAVTTASELPSPTQGRVAVSISLR